MRCGGELDSKKEKFGRSIKKRSRGAWDSQKEKFLDEHKKKRSGGASSSKKEKVSEEHQNNEIWRNIGF